MTKTKENYLYMGKPLAMVLGWAPMMCGAGSEGITRGGVNSVSQFDRESNMVPASSFCEGRAQRRNNGLC